MKKYVLGYQDVRQRYQMDTQFRDRMQAQGWTWYNVDMVDRVAAAPEREG